MGPDKLDGLHRRSVGNHHHVIDHFQRRQGLGAEGVIKKRTARPLVHMRGRSKGDHQNVTKLFCFLEMNHMTRMDQVKGTVTLDELSALPAQFPESSSGLSEGKDFVAHGLWM